MQVLQKLVWIVKIDIKFDGNESGKVHPPQPFPTSLHFLPQNYKLRIPSLSFSPFSHAFRTTFPSQLTSRLYWLLGPTSVRLQPSASARLSSLVLYSEEYLKHGKMCFHFKGSAGLLPRTSGLRLTESINQNDKGAQTVDSSSQLVTNGCISLLVSPYCSAKA